MSRNNRSRNREKVQNNTKAGLRFTQKVTRKSYVTDLCIAVSKLSPPRKGEEHLHTGFVPGKIICISA